MHPESGGGFIEIAEILGSASARASSPSSEKASLVARMPYFGFVRNQLAEIGGRIAHDQKRLYGVHLEFGLLSLGFDAGRADHGGT
jgi:hypothetical protein